MDYKSDMKSTSRLVVFLRLIKVYRYIHTHKLCMWKSLIQSLQYKVALVTVIYIMKGERRSPLSQYVFITLFHKITYFITCSSHSPFSQKETYFL